MGMGNKKAAAIARQKARDRKVAAMQEEAPQTSFELLYGNKGVPQDGARVVDMLGRPLKDAIPPLLAAPKKPVVSQQVDRKVTLMRDHTLDYPDLFLEVFVAGDKYEEAAFAQMFSRSRCQRAKSVLEADLVVFTGGVDVDPGLYGEAPHKTTMFNEKRDTDDINLYLMCKDEGIPMFGVCRGAQFLHVMQGGKLYQHVNNHYGDHSMYDVRDQKMIEKVSSVHHQMVIQNVTGGMEILGTSVKATERWKNPNDCVVGSSGDIEAFFYRDVCAFGVQGHPEYAGYNYYTKWCLDQINELVVMNPDIAWTNKNRRIRPELLAERDAVTPSIILPSAVEGETN
jgi:gamma-glutamyl-gamma-aminobutyrate hydrolase PuuD